MDGQTFNYIYRLYPSNEQRRWLAYNLKAVARIWNDLLTQEQQRQKEGALASPRSLLIAQARRYILKDEFKYGDPSSYGMVAAKLHRRLKAAAEGSVPYPRMLEEDGTPLSYAIRNEDFSVEMGLGKLHLPFMGWVKVRGLRPFPYGSKIVAVHIHKKKDNRVYAVVQVRMALRRIGYDAKREEMPPIIPTVQRLGTPSFSE